jgi:hypothetical protein
MTFHKFGNKSIVHAYIALRFSPERFKNNVTLGAISGEKRSYSLQKRARNG